MTKPYTDSWLKVEESLGGARPVLAGSAEEMRGQFMGLVDALAPMYPPPSSAMRTQEGTIGTFKYCIYSPVESNGRKTPPVGVYYHPGGLVIGASAYDGVLCHALAEATGSIIISIRHRLSPEHKAPAHLEDALRAFEWANQTAVNLGGDPARMFTIGASAGAGLALCVARKVALGQSSAATDSVKGVVAFAPYSLHPDHTTTAFQSTHLSYAENGVDAPIINKAAMLQCFQDAGLSPDDMDYFAALDSEHHSLYPPTYIATCEMDPVRDDGKIMAKSLESAGVSVKTDHYPGLPHCFWMFPSLPETGVFMYNAISGVKWVINQM